MATTLRVACAAIWPHRFVLIEHPRAPRLVQAASIRRTDTMRALLAAPLTSKVQLLQGSLGQVSPKPITSMTHRVPGIQAALWRCQLPQHEWPKPHRDQMIAKASDDSWATALLKSFPQRLSRAVADAIIDAVGNACRVGTLDTTVAKELAQQADTERITGMGLDLPRARRQLKLEAATGSRASSAGSEDAIPFAATCAADGLASARANTSSRASAGAITHTSS